jgi:hypothetical protein
VKHLAEQQRGGFASASDIGARMPDERAAHVGDR